MPNDAIRTYERVYPFGWLGVLSDIHGNATAAEAGRHLDQVEVPLLGEHLTRRKSLGAAIGFLGIILITLGKPVPLGETAHYFQLQPASLAIIGSAICTSFYVIFQKKYLAETSALHFTAWCIWAGTLLLAPVFSWQLILTVPQASTRSTLEIVYLGIFPAALAYLTFAYATQRLLAARVMSFLFLVPPLAMVIAWLYPTLREWPTPVSLTGGALAILGVAIVNSARKIPTLVIVEEA